MRLNKLPDLRSFLSSCFQDADPDADPKAVLAFAASTPTERLRKVTDQMSLLLTEPELPLDELGNESNRWFGSSDEARAWLESIVATLESSRTPSGPEILAKDCNGTPLREGDSVQVIKDLKVKGGSSDLKRGTMIKRIHLIDDPEAIECRVDGSVLVLKTCFLKRA